MKVSLFYQKTQLKQQKVTIDCHFLGNFVTFVTFSYKHEKGRCDIVKSVNKALQSNKLIISISRRLTKACF